MEDFGTLNEIEASFAAYIETAPAEQQKHFRDTLNTLMQCYGERPSLGVLAAVVNKTDGSLQVIGLNMVAAEMEVVARYTVTVITESETGVPENEELH